MSSCQVYRPNVSIFENITECNQIRNDACNTIQVSTFANYELDKYIKEMEPEKFFICEYTSTQLNFTLYAYTFKNNDDAQQYFYYVTGKRNNPTTTFSDSSGIIFRRIAVDGANIYRVSI